MVTTRQKPTVATQKRRLKKSKNTTTESHNITKEESKRRTEEIQTARNNKNGNKYLFINNYFKINILNSPLKRH